MSDAPLADRVHQHLVDELHDRRVVARVVAAARSSSPPPDVESLQALGVVVIRRPASAVSPATMLRALDPVLVDQDRLDREVGVELDLVQRAVLVGSLMPTNSQPPRLNIGNAPCWHQFLAHQPIADCAGSGW